MGGYWSVYSERYMRACKESIRTLAGSSPRHQGLHWKKVWNAQAMPRVKHFIWHLMRNIVPVRCRRAQKGLVVDTTYPMCGEEEESVDHLFINCSYAGLIWKLSPSWEFPTKILCKLPWLAEGLSMLPERALTWFLYILLGI